MMGMKKRMKRGGSVKKRMKKKKKRQLKNQKDKSLLFLPLQEKWPPKAR